MAVPDFQKLLLPLLKICSDQKEHTNRETEDRLAAELQLTKGDLEEMLPSGTQRRFVNRVAWAKVHLSKVGLIEPVRKSVYKITQRGLDLLKENPDAISVAFLKRYEGFNEFLKPTKDADPLETSTVVDSIATPRETLEN